MAIGGSPPGATRAKDGSKGAAGRFTFLVEVARGYLGALWLARDPADASEDGTAFVRHVTPLVAASARAAILDGARWAIAGSDTDRLEVVEGRSAVDLVSPYVDGEILRSLLRTAAVKHTHGEPHILLGLARAIVTELGPHHERALTNKSPHGFGGLHPDSVLVDQAGRVHLLDVGAGAAASAREPWRSDPQRIGYAAPEQLDPRGVADARTDVFALGIFLWEALANRRLFPGNDAKAARERVQKANIPRLDATRPSSAAGVATDIADVVARCLERDPARRYQSLDELGAALDALEPAPAALVATWVNGIADTAISKRRQLLERAAAGTLTGEERLTLPPASTDGVRPASMAPARPASVSPVRPASVTPRPGADRPSSVPAAAPRPSVVPTAPAVPRVSSVAPRSGGTLPGPTPPPPAVHPTASSGPPPPPSARAAAAAAAAAVVAPPRPPSAQGSATATPVVGSPTPPVVAASATSTPVVNTPPPATGSATTTPIAGPAPPPAAVPATVAEAPAAPAADEAPAPDGAERASVADATPEPERTTMDVADEGEEEEVDRLDEDVEDDESSPVASKRPPPLPHEESHLPLAAVAPGGHTEPLAQAIPTNQLAALTAPAAPALPRSAVAAALISLLALGAFIVIRYRAHAPPPPQIERTVQTPPFRIEEPLSAVPAAAPPPTSEPEPPKAASAAPPAPSAEKEHATAATAAPAETPAPPPAETAAPAPPPKEEAAPKTARPHATAPSNESSHRPASHDVKPTGFKPGGI